MKDAELHRRLWPLVLAITLGLAGIPGAAFAQAKDTLKTTNQLDGLINRYFHGQQNAWVRVGARAPWPAACDADRGQVCMQGVIPIACPDGTACQPYTNLVDPALKAALAHPHAAFITGFATFALVNAGRLPDAFEVASGCRAAAWWCSLLKGYVYHAVSRLPAAESEFRSGLSAASDSVRCTYVDASWAVQGKLRDRLKRLPCAQRVVVSDSVWWLADPSYASPGNERWTEQIARVFYRQFDALTDSLIFPGYRARWSPTLSARILARGPVDSWRNSGVASNGAVRFDFWTSKKAARYHFVPDFEGDSLSRPVWHLNGTIEEEGYTPPGPPFYEVPAQIARFRNGDSMVVAVAGTLAGMPIAHAAVPTAYLVLSDAPDSFPLKLSSTLTDERAVFLGQAAVRSWVTSFEVLSKEGIGRHRIMLQPLQVQGPGVSDVLLYSPAGPELPDSLRMAAGMMLGDTTVSKGDQLGIYWETYGAPKGRPVTVELEVEREGGGLLSQLKNLVPGLGPSSSARPSWTATSPGPVFRRAVVLDLSELDSGSYTLLLKTSWPGQEVLETRRRFVVR
jgi:hypothetical protein